jgi:peptide/nickel transport system permease protein
MLTAIVRRVLLVIPNIVLLTLILFWSVFELLGTPITMMLGRDADLETIATLNAQYGFDRPVFEQYVSWMGNALQGDFGRSYITKQSVADAIAPRILVTLELAAIAVLLATIATVIMNSIPVARRAVGSANTALSLVGITVPNFMLGISLIYILSVQLGWLPTSGRFETASIVLPAATLGIVHGGRIFQLVRSATFEEMSKPYVTVARSKGLTEWNILRRHVVRNTGVTTATIVGWEYVRMWGGAVFAIEYVFAWPGIGLLTIDAAHRQDFFVLQAAVIIAGAFVIFSNLLIDMGYQFIDRRIAAT